MKMIRDKAHSERMVIGTVAVLVLLAGSMAWAGKKDGKIQLKKDKTVKQEQKQDAQQLDPFQDLVRMQQQMERLFNSTLNPYSGDPEFDYAFEEPEILPLDLRERPDAFVVQMDLPGLEKKDISIEVKDRILTVSGERKTTTKNQKKEKILMQERAMNSFSRELVLTKDVKADAVTAEYKNGVLTITLPKTKVDQESHKIEIK